MAKIYVVDQPYRAGVKAFEVKQEHEADILVFVVAQEYQAKDDALWFYVKAEYQASTKLFWVDQAHPSSRLTIRLGGRRAMLCGVDFDRTALNRRDLPPLARLYAQLRRPVPRS